MTQPTPRVRRAPAAETSAASSHLLRTWAGAVPAIVAVACILVFVAIVMAQRADRTLDEYRQAAAAATEAHDYKTARVCYERLLQTDDENPALLYGLASSLGGLGQFKESSQILQRLAPPDTAGYAPAQLLVAEQLLAGSPTPDAVRLAETHLRHALETDPGNAEAQTVLSSLHPGHPGLGQQ